MNAIERKILAYAAELNPDFDHHERLHRLVSRYADMDQLIDLADKEGLTCLVYKKFEKSGLLETLAPHQRERLQSSYYKTAGFNLKLIHDLKEILQVVNQENIRVVLLQGMDLLQQLYEDIGLRPMIDVDLWVLQKYYAGLISILTSQGYQRDPIYPNTFRKSSTTFDLHTHILWADRIEARKWLLHKGEEDIYLRARPMDFEGKEAFCLNPSDQVLYLGLHALKHHMNRLIWLVDIKCLLARWNRSDWKALITRARELGQEKTLSYILFLLENLFDFQLPAEAHQFMQRKRIHVLEKRILRKRITGTSLPFWAPVFLFSSEIGLRHRFLFIFENVFPRPEIMRQIFVDSMDRRVWQLYLMRILELVKRIKK
ncbi:MAG: nucleotidyltransferase family protein [Deltaproteobacteria bacterium]|nr:MAG: nucleotidyltransferase family protein [Deltaproteobacteria bacterium]